MLQEWRDVVSPEWFDAWIPEMFREERVVEISVKTEHALRKRLVGIGFPKGKDWWYVKVACAVSNSYQSSILVSEDLDFIEPREKLSGSRRRGRLLRGGGRVRRELRRCAEVDVMCVEDALRS